MNYFFITGTSKGLGRALSELLLTDKNNIVYGFSRTCSISHENYIHTIIDFSNLKQVSNYQFPELNNTDKITLVNNAGIVGDIKHVGKIDNQKIIDCYNINTITPAILINNFMKNYTDNKLEKLIINISSGAGRSAIDGWNTYCSSKAALDMFSQVVNKEVGIDTNKCTILSLAPGIIDTNMQVEIRSANQENFSNINNFINYKEDGELSPADKTAKQVLQFIKNPKIANDTVCSIRELSQ